MQHPSAQSMPFPALRRRSRLALVLSALFIAGCDYPIASQDDVDVCALVHDTVSAAFNEPLTAASNPNACVLTTTSDSPTWWNIQVTILTDASTGYSGGMKNVLPAAMAEAGQNSGAPGLDRFAGLPDVSVAFGTSPEHLRQVIVAERGVMMELSLTGQITVGQDEMAALTRDLWTRVTSYK